MVFLKITKNNNSKKANYKRNWWQIILVPIVILTFLVLAIRPGSNDKSKPNKSRRTEIKFTKEGELSFFKKDINQEIKSIDIEISENDQERMIGLMYRYKMEIVYPLKNNLFL